jgi:hypothetical protein
MDRYTPTLHRDNKTLPKHFSPPLTCFFWSQNGRCNKRDVDCAYAHYLTGHLAAAPINIPGRTYSSLLGVGKSTNGADPYATVAVAGKNFCDMSASAAQMSEREEKLRAREMEVARRERGTEEREDEVRRREREVRRREERVAGRERTVRRTGQGGRRKCGKGVGEARGGFAE